MSKSFLLPMVELLYSRSQYMFNIDTEFNRGDDNGQTVNDANNSPARKRLDVVR